MSFFESITKKSKLKSAIKQITEARKSEGDMADQLFKKAYEDFADVVANEPVIAEALYNWGFALLHQARTLPAEKAAMLYQDAIAKFSFCLTIEPAYLGAAIDGGVAYMELARVKGVEPDDGLYGSAKSYFEKANAIQAGAASYNLACIYGLNGDKEACLTALEIAKGKGSLPTPDDILNDPDLAKIKNQDWFAAFMESLNQKPEAVPEVSEAIVIDPISAEKTNVMDTVVAVEPEAVVANTQADEKAEITANNDAVINEFKAIDINFAPEKTKTEDQDTANSTTEELK